MDENLSRRLITNAASENLDWEMVITPEKKDRIFSIMTNHGTLASLNYDHYLVNNKNEIIPIKLAPVNEKAIIKRLKVFSRKYEYLVSNKGGEVGLKPNGIYHVVIPVSKSDDGSCCPSGMIKYKTTDFKTIIPGSLYYMQTGQNDEKAGSRETKNPKWILVK